MVKTDDQSLSAPPEFVVAVVFTSLPLKTKYNIIKKNVHTFYCSIRIDISSKNTSLGSMVYSKYFNPFFTIMSL